MKFVVRNLKVGQRVSARVEDLLPEGEILASFQGDLLRIRNVTGRRFTIGQNVSLQVMAVQPLKFQLVKTPIAGGLDKMV